MVCLRLEEAMPCMTSTSSFRQGDSGGVLAAITSVAF